MMACSQALRAKSGPPPYVLAADSSWAVILDLGTIAKVARGKSSDVEG